MKSTKATRRKIVVVAGLAMACGTDGMQRPTAKPAGRDDPCAGVPGTAAEVRRGFASNDPWRATVLAVLHGIQALGVGYPSFQKFRVGAFDASGPSRKEEPVSDDETLLTLEFSRESGRRSVQVDYLHQRVSGPSFQGTRFSSDQGILLRFSLAGSADSRVEARRSRHDPSARRAGFVNPAGGQFPFSFACVGPAVFWQGGPSAEGNERALRAVNAVIECAASTANELNGEPYTYVNGDAECR